jgi:hypothetical protein
VKFRNIDANTLQTLQTGGDHCSEDHHVSDVDAESEDDGDDKLDADAASPPPEAEVFEIDPDIDINSKALRDMVSVDPVVCEVQPQEGSVAMASQAPAGRLNWDW